MRREITHPTPDHAARGQRAAIFTFSNASRLSQIRAETLVATGTEDALVPPGNSRILASRIPAAQLTLVPGLGHRAIWEAPGEMAELIRDFLGRSTSQRDPT